MIYITNTLFYLGYIHFFTWALRLSADIVMNGHSEICSISENNREEIIGALHTNRWSSRFLDIQGPLHHVSGRDYQICGKPKLMTLIYRSGQTVWSVVTPKEGSYRIPTLCTICIGYILYTGSKMFAQAGIVKAITSWFKLHHICLMIYSYLLYIITSNECHAWFHLMSFAELRGKRSKQKIQNKKVSTQWDSNP